MQPASWTIGARRIKRNAIARKFPDIDRQKIGVQRIELPNCDFHDLGNLNRGDGVDCRPNHSRGVARWRATGSGGSGKTQRRHGVTPGLIVIVIP